MLTGPDAPERDAAEADALFTVALELGIEDRRARAETELQRATARVRAGRSDEAIEALRAAAEIARELGDAERKVNGFLHGFLVETIRGDLGHAQALALETADPADWSFFQGLQAILAEQSVDVYSEG